VGPTPLPAFGCGEVTVRAPLDPFLVDVLRGLPPLGWCTGSRDPSRTGHGVREGFGPIRAARPRIERFGGGKVFFFCTEEAHTEPVTETLIPTPISPPLLLMLVFFFPSDSMSHAAALPAAIEPRARERAAGEEASVAASTP
jgi:hypothetical protein